jgi:hypothetical protein
MHLLPGLIMLLLALALFSLPIAANHLRLRHHDHLLPGHPRGPR